jgi:hypothetical protein
MKIDVSHIVIDHISTLVNATNNKISMLDIFTFYITPMIGSYLFVSDLGAMPESFYGLAISVFSIFAALLFSVQIALFSILQRNEGEVQSSKQIPAIERRVAARRALIKELNANISYLILIACLGVAMLLAFAAMPRFNAVFSYVSAYFVSHFVLTILLVISRVHTLFNEEYKP